MDDIKIDVEEPRRDIVTIPWAQAAEEYLLGQADLEAMQNGQVVWYRDVALTLHEASDD